MGDFILINRFILFSIDFFGLWLAVWIFLTDKKAKINQRFFLTTIFILSWITLVYFASITTGEKEAIILSKLAFVPVYLFLISIYFFVKVFPREGKKLFFLDFSVLMGASFLFLVTLFSDFHIKGVTFREWGVSPVFGRATVLVYSIIFLITVLFSVILFRKYFRLSQPEKLKVQYFIAGFVIFVTMNVIFNVFLATKYTDFPYYIIGNYSAIFFLGFTAYAIVARELFGIRVILTQTLVGIIAILLLAQAVTSATWLEFSWKFALFVIFLYFGYLLIRSVIQEIKRRAELQKLYEEVDKLSKTKSEFISIASHQLRTPLTAIKGYISMIIEGTYGKLGEKQAKPLGNVYQSNERLIKLVNDLLNLSRLEAGKIEFEPKLSSLEELISGVIDEMKINAEKKDLTINLIRPSISLPKITLDQDKIRQVILNLVDNAIKYTKEGGITIELKQLDSSQQVKISDTGEGMTKEEIDSLFQMFSRATAGTQLHTEGAGIGLYVAKQFIEMHQGKIWAESAGKGKGSTFYIELPIK